MRHKLTAVLAILVIAGVVALWPNGYEPKPAPTEGLSRVQSIAERPEADEAQDSFDAQRWGKTTSTAEPPAPRLHTVANNEGLSQIAPQYGVVDWRRLFDANTAIQHQDLTFEGQQLRIPESQEQLARRDLVLPPPPPPPAARSSQPPVQTQTRSGPRSAPVRSSDDDSSLAAIRNCESGGDYGAVSSSGRYGGAYQFDQQTWESVGGTGTPHEAPPAEQDAAAERLRAERGSSPWPTCG